MSTEHAVREQPPSKSGEAIHRRESLLQIYLPFILGLLLLLGLVLVVAFPSDPIWRIRAQAIADFTYMVMCLLPILLCNFAAFMLVSLGMWGMYRVHSTTERPLRKLENLSAGLASRINNVSDYISQKTIDVSSIVEPALDKINPFDTPSATGEEVADATTEQ